MPRYYLVQVDWEYMADNQAAYTLLKTKAARLRPPDLCKMKRILGEEGVWATFVPTSYKPVGAHFLDPYEWQANRRYFWKGSKQ